MAAARARFLGALEDFCGLDASGSQLRDKFAIRGKKIVSSKFFWQGPGNLLESARRYVRFGDCGGEETDLQFVGRFRITMPDAANLCAFHQRHAEFFL